MTRPRGWAVVGGAALLGAAALAIGLLGLDVPLLHHDARAHLLVARRLTDGIRPGLHQLGAGWLPGYTLVMAPVAAWWPAYRTGWVGAGLSVVCHGLSAIALLRLLTAEGVREQAGVPVTLVWALAPAPLALAGMPMTEGPTLALILWGFALPDGLKAGLLLGAAATFRYEGVAALAAALLTSRRRGPLALGAAAVLAPVYGLMAYSRPELGGALSARFVGGPAMSARVGAWVASAAVIWGVPLLVCLAWIRPRRRLTVRLASLAAAFPASLLLGMPPRPRYAVFLGPLIALGLARASQGRRWVVAVALLGAALPTLGISPARIAPHLVSSWAGAPPGLSEALSDVPAWAAFNTVVLEARVSDLPATAEAPLLDALRTRAAPDDRLVAGMSANAGLIHRLGWPLSRVIWEGDADCWTTPASCGGRWRVLRHGEGTPVGCVEAVEAAAGLGSVALADCDTVRDSPNRKTAD